MKYCKNWAKCKAYGYPCCNDDCPNHSEKSKKEAQPWWKYLDWSTMRNTYPKLSKELQKRIFDEGYWSLGKGRFEEEKAQP